MFIIETLLWFWSFLAVFSHAKIYLYQTTGSHCPGVQIFVSVEKKFEINKKLLFSSSFARSWWSTRQFPVQSIIGTHTHTHTYTYIHALFLLIHTRTFSLSHFAAKFSLGGLEIWHGQIDRRFARAHFFEQRYWFNFFSTFDLQVIFGRCNHSFEYLRRTRNEGKHSFGHYLGRPDLSVLVFKGSKFLW